MSNVTLDGREVTGWSNCGVNWDLFEASVKRRLREGKKALGSAGKRVSLRFTLSRPRKCFRLIRTNPLSMLPTSIWNIATRICTASGTPQDGARDRSRSMTSILAAIGPTGDHRCTLGSGRSLQFAMPLCAFFNVHKQGFQTQTFRRCQFLTSLKFSEILFLYDF